MTLEELKKDTRFFLFGEGTDQGRYTTADIERNINRWYRIVATWIWQVSGTWEYDDSNKTTLPTATTDLADGRKDYTLPSDAQKLIEVEIKDSNEKWRDLKEIDKSQMGQAPSEFEDTAGLPKYYDLVANALILYPAPDSDNVTGTKGLRVHVSREVDALSATSDEPGFSKAFHTILSIGAAHDWAVAHGEQQKEVDLRRKLRGDSTSTGFKDDLREYYGVEKNRDKEQKITPSKSNYE